MEMKVKDIVYDEVGKYKNLQCRAVVTKTGRTGEFHVRSTSAYPADAIVQLLQGVIDNADIGVIGLDYDVYIKSESVLVNDGMEELLKEADDFIERIQNA